jgi:hypothetical protein
MDKAVTDRIEQQVKLAFPDGAITRVQVLQYGDDPGGRARAGRSAGLRRLAGPV